MKAKPVILVVDDQPQNIELLEVYLVPQGYEIIKAVNGEEALGKLSGNQIDLILLDVMMPGMDGFEVTRRVRQDDNNRLIPIVLVTALRETEDRVKGIESGCDDFLSKPVDKMELLARVQSLLKVKAYNDLMSNYQKELESAVTKRTEELRFTNALLITQNETSLDGILTVDEQGRMISYNQPFINLWGIPSDIAKSRSDANALQPVIDKIIDPEGFIKLVNYLYEHKEEKSRDEIRLKDGRVLDRFSAPMFSADQHYYGRVWYFRDITERRRFEEDLKNSYQKTKNTLNDAINTMAKIVETRDPYTAGHQQRVADLAIAIAREMQLDHTRIDQLRMAAVIHDIGKMYVPSDILSKPGKLSNIEFSLIKNHSQSGYDIVQGMDFPPAIAQSILQHHERLDGSGYPNGLKGEDTLLEAKILAVADVIEAMSSHRPYRPAQGIDKALEEISKNKDRLYDSDVVNACMKLFAEKGFKFKQ
jgi:putative nucleotidyltransferase with HDIG domain